MSTLEGFHCTCIPSLEVLVIMTILTKHFRSNFSMLVVPTQALGMEDEDESMAKAVAKSEEEYERGIAERTRQDTGRCGRLVLIPAWDVD